MRCRLLHGRRDVTTGCVLRLTMSHHPLHGMLPPVVVPRPTTKCHLLHGMLPPVVIPRPTMKCHLLCGASQTALADAMASPIRSLSLDLSLHPEADNQVTFHMAHRHRLAKEHTPAWGTAPLIHILLVWPPIDRAHALRRTSWAHPTSRLLGASDVVPLGRI